MRTSFWTKLLDLISPRPCAICGARLTATESVLCGRCHLHLPLTRYETAADDNPMARLFWGLLPVERAAAWFFYHPQSDSSKLIFNLKYHNQPELGRLLGAIVARQFAESGFFQGIEAIVPVPLTRRRQWQRSYNQSLEIARGISDVTRLPILDRVVRRVRFADSQTHKSQAERRDNVDGAFRLRDGRKVSGRHLLLVDDIVTTGATLTACGTALCQAGGVRLSIIALGLAASDGQNTSFSSQ